jgi:hypothetical protein
MGNSLLLREDLLIPFPSTDQFNRLEHLGKLSRGKPIASTVGSIAVESLVAVAKLPDRNL